MIGKNAQIKLKILEMFTIQKKNNVKTNVQNVSTLQQMILILWHLLNKNLASLPQVGGYRAIDHGETQGGISAVDLRQTDLELTDTLTCRLAFGNSVTDNQLCFIGASGVGGFRNGTCSGDSGGPVYYWNGIDYLQVGVTSFGPKSCGYAINNLTSAFTNVYKYKDWIDSVMAGGVTPKAYVTTRDGNRVLVNNDPAPAVSNSGGGGGGSVGITPVILLLLFNLFREAARCLRT